MVFMWELRATVFCIKHDAAGLSPQVAKELQEKTGENNDYCFLFSAI